MQRGSKIGSLGDRDRNRDRRQRDSSGPFQIPGNMQRGSKIWSLGDRDRGDKKRDRRQKDSSGQPSDPRQHAEREQDREPGRQRQE